MKDAFVKVKTDVLSSKYEAAVAREIPIYSRGNGIRSEFERDYTRLLHCQAYSRLKHKTQVFFAPHNDHVCTRMEHVLHVASVASTIAKYLGLNQDLTQSIAIGHDIGHAPFGHSGEEILNDLLGRKEGANAPKKFWHERNSLFFADYIETLDDPNGIKRPLNLTYAVRDGLICHCGEVDQQGMKPRNENMNLYEIKRPGLVQPFTWEGCVVKISDKIAFLGRDIQDARAYHLLDMGSYRQLREIVTETLGMTKNGQTLSHRSGRAVNPSVLINDMIVDLCENSNPDEGLYFSESYFRFIRELKKFSFSNIYNHWRLQEFQKYARNVLETVFNALMRAQIYVQKGTVETHLKNYPKLGEEFTKWLLHYSNYASVCGQKKSPIHSIPEVFDINDNESYKKCVIEFISGCTDDFAIACFEEVISF
ncbi:MAG: HD domain-containing protein [Treponema sp.]|nr:HD domain-containing protein [Candidatus Treponema equifaecale]